MVLRLRTVAVAMAVLVAAGCSGQLVPTPSPVDLDGIDTARKAGLAAAEVIAEMPEEIVSYAYDHGDLPEERALHLHLVRGHDLADGQQIACGSVQPALDAQGAADLHFVLYGDPADGEWIVSNEFCDN
jgi:hypothetical protein